MGGLGCKFGVVSYAKLENFGSRILGTSRCQRTKFWNLNLEINTTPDLGTLNFAMGFRLIANFDSSICMNCQTEIDGQILTWEDEKVLPR